MSGQQNNTKQYSATEMLRYLNGQMDRKETHAFERAMLDDELLADSVEGYRMMRESLSDQQILSMAQKVSEPIKKNEEKAPVVAFSGLRWVGYAAAACLVLAAGWWIFSISGRQNAIVPKSDDRENPALVITDEVDSSLNGKRPTISGQGEVAASEPSQKATAPAGNAGKTEPDARQDIAMATEKNASPVPANTTILPADAIATEQKMAEKPVSTLKMAPADHNRDNNPNRFTLADSSVAVPANGWPAYRDYLDQTLALPAYKSPSTIEVIIGPNGKVSSVKVLGAAEKEKAAIINALQNGPAWKNRTGNPAKAIIRLQ